VRWQVKAVPLARDTAPRAEVLRSPHLIGYDGVDSVHSEYAGGESWRLLDRAQLLEQARRDLACLRGLAQPGR
jgi:hypothetical protein